MTLRWLDASTPPASYPTGFDGIAFYIGGDTPHVWTVAEIEACPYRYRLPIFVRSDPAASSVTASGDVTSAVSYLKQIGAPLGIMVAWDSETSVDPEYIQAVYADLHAAGYVLIDYGSQSMIFGNQNPDGYYWGADWTNTPHITTGDVMTQYQSLGGWDDSWGNPGPAGGTPLPWWDTRPPAPVVPPVPVLPAPPGQWNAGGWQWQDVVITGVGLDGKLHTFAPQQNGEWVKV
jgi:hypothetical protein